MAGLRTSPNTAPDHAHAGGSGEDDGDGDEVHHNVHPLGYLLHSLTPCTRIAIT